MDVLKSSLLSGLADRMGFLTRRAGVIAENIANADTPDYVARDVKAPEFKRLAAAASMRVSDPRHMTAGAQSRTARIVDAPDPEAALNGNRVSLEAQTVKLAKTRMDYQLAATVYRKGLDLVRLAARGAGR